MRLIKELPTCRYYELDFTITKGCRGEVEPTNLIQISDAHTHIERLAFPIYLMEGFTLEDLANGTKYCVRRDSVQIAGEWTWMIHGGDPNSIREDWEYIEELRKLNER